MAEINLLDNQAPSSVIKAQGKLWLVRLITTLFALVVLVYVALLIFGWVTSRSIDQAKETVAKYQADFKNNKDREEVITRQGQLKNANQLIAGHRYWSPVLPELARVTLTSATYSSITVDVKDGLDLTVNTPSYEEAEKYLQVFDLPEYNKQFSNVKLLTLTKSEGNNKIQTTMRLHLTVNPSLYKK